MTTRRESRQEAFCLLFEKAFSDQTIDQIIENAEEGRELVPSAFALELAKGTAEHLEEIDELIRPAVTVPDWAREEADIAPDAKLDCYVDEDTHELTVVEADYAHDLSDVPPELLFALHQSGCCLSALEDALMEDDVIYDK